MELKDLNNTGIKISVIGIGTWEIGSAPNPKIPMKETMKAIENW